MSNQPVIVAAKRTPIGRFFGSLANVPSPQIGAFAIEAVLNDAPAAKDHVDECIMGCVLQAGLGQNPARQAGLKAGLPSTLSAKTINKVCGSGLEAVMMAAQSIKAGDNHCVVAGGMENMTGSPHFAHVRQGVKYGPGTMEDHMAFDGLRCAFECWPMGNAAEHIAEKYGVTREDQDRFGAQSHVRAAAAWDAGHFDSEVVTLTGEQIGNRKVPGPEGGISRDEGIRGDSTAEGLGKLRPAFSKDGTITAGNASQISDGAAATIVMSEAKAKELGLAPLCRIVAYHTSGVDPKDIFAAPIEGVKGALAKAGWSVDDVDLYELNEAFAAQALCNAKELGINEAKMNICGGGVALGHPIGASGARVLVTLIHQLKRTGGKKGVAALCLGGGNAVAMCVEMC
ncbi:MAG: acetyl-CoA C-acetyltransferase [Phycisphaerales bacterium]|nr:acetyl-CoA C-acetyltransferase [Phycisphaerales bacterium]